MTQTLTRSSTMTMGSLQTWLKRLTAPKGLEIPAGLPADLADLRTRINLDLLDTWFTELGKATTLVELSTSTDKLTDLSLSGTVSGTKLKLTIRFIAADDKPKSGDPVAGVVVNLPLAGTKKFAFLADVLTSLTLDFEIKILNGAAKRRLSASGDFKVSAKRTLKATAELGADADATSYEFTVAPSEQISVTEALHALGFTDAPPLAFLPSFTGLTLHYDVLKKDEHRIIVHPAKAPDGAVTWTAAVLPKQDKSEEDKSKKGKQKKDEEKKDKEKGGKGKSRPVVASVVVPFGSKTRLSNLDLLRGQVPADCDLQVKLQAVYTSQDLKVDQIKTLNKALGKSAQALPDAADLHAGATLAALVTIGDKTHTLVVRKPANKKVRPAGEKPQEDQTAVQKVERALGSLHVRQVQVRLVPASAGTPERLLVDLNAGFTATGFELEATGLGLEIELTKTPAVRVVLRGLGVSYSRDPLHVLGTLTARPPDRRYEFAYDGLIMVKAATWGLMAVGSYARITTTQRHPAYTSLFVFGASNGEVGTPPVVFTGLALGFGYNSRLALPTADKVADFPFVQALTDMGKLTGAEPDKPINPTKVLEKVTGGADAVVSPADGVLWLAAGVSASIAQTVNVAGLLIVQVGTADFLVALLGTMSADFPTRSEDSEETPSIAHIEMGFRALYEHAERRFSLTAALGDTSWIFHEDCKLTGGAAVCVWFPGSVHEGDFVATVGGYHPAFTKPAHYPEVPRLGLNWSAGSAVAVKGELYVAVTPEAGMVGGRLEVGYDAGGLRAWLVAYFNVIVWWAPLYFHADIGITIGASYTMHCWLFSVTVRVEIGATLQVWGPPAGGRAHLRAGPFSVTIGFGADQAPRARRLDWKEFRSRQLPQAPITLSVLDGLLTDPAMVEQAVPGTWIVSTDGFAFTTGTAIPATQVGYNSVPQALEDRPLVAGVRRNRKKRLDVRPMRYTGDSSKASTLTVSVTRDPRGGPRDAGPSADATDWTVVPRYSAVPKALWGEVSDAPPRPEAVASSPTEVYATGLEVRMPAPRLVGDKVDTSVEVLRQRPWSGQVNPLRHTASRRTAPDGPDVIPETAFKEMRQVLNELGLLEVLA